MIILFVIAMTTLIIILFVIALMSLNYIYLGNTLGATN